MGNISSGMEAAALARATSAYLSRQDFLEKLNQEISEQVQAEVGDANGKHFWANPDNLNEAISESLAATGEQNSRQLSQLLIAKDYAAAGHLMEAIARDYQTNYVNRILRDQL